MRIVVDLQCCQNASRVRGIGRYALAMTRALASVGPDHEWLVLLSDRFPDTITPIRAALADVLPPEAIHVCALPARIAAAEPADAWRCRAAQVVRIAYLEALAPDLVFLPSLFEGFHDDVAVSLDTIGCPVAVTVHDFIPLEEPARYLPTPADEVAYRRRLRELGRADLVLAISEYTARQTVELAGIDPARIVVAPNGVDPALAALAAAAPPDAPARLGITRPFVLNTSPIEHRKNVHGLIAAFALLPPGMRDHYQLVIAGRIDDGGRRDVAAWTADAGLPPDAVVTPGHVSEADLAALYGACAVFAFPSFSEGFGLPPLEAMSCGAAVIAADATALPEVVGRPDMLVDPADPTALAEAVERVLSEPGRRAALAVYGIERAAQFTWDATARAALTAFDRFGAIVPRATIVPPSTRPQRIAIVLPERDDAMLRGKAATLATLLPAATRIDIVGGGDVPDAALDVLGERRSLAWFDRHALVMDTILYVAAGLCDPAWALRMATYRGVVVQLDGWWLDQKPEPLDGAMIEGQELRVLPATPFVSAPYAWRAELGIAASQKLDVVFTAGQVKTGLPSPTIHWVPVEEPELGERYRILIGAADRLRAVGAVATPLLAQLHADACHRGIPFDSVPTTLPPGASPPCRMATMPNDMAAWSTALASALRQVPTALLRRVAERLVADVRGVGPGSDDLAQIAIVIANNVEHLPAVPVDQP